MLLTLILPVTTFSHKLQSLLSSWEQFSRQDNPTLHTQLMLVDDGMSEGEQRRLELWQHAQSEQSPQQPVLLIRHRTPQGEGQCYLSAIQYVMSRPEQVDSDWVALIPTDFYPEEACCWIAPVWNQLYQSLADAYMTEIIPVETEGHHENPGMLSPAWALQTLEKGIAMVTNWVKDQCGIEKSLPIFPAIQLVRINVLEKLQGEFGTHFIQHKGVLGALELTSKLHWVTARIGRLDIVFQHLTAKTCAEEHLRFLETLWTQRDDFWSLSHWLQYRIDHHNKTQVPQSIQWEPCPETTCPKTSGEEAAIATSTSQTLSLN